MPPETNNASSTETKPEKTPILLLKNQTTPRDGYDEYFRQTNQTYQPIFIPVLEHRIRTENLARVRDLLLQNNDSNNDNKNNNDDGKDKEKKRKKYGGVIFTSQRAVEGFATILNGINSS